jgi:hypothetical protein
MCPAKPIADFAHRSDGTWRSGHTSSDKSSMDNL